MRLLLSMGLRPRPGAPLRPALRWLDPDNGRLEDVEVRALAPHHHPSEADHAELTGAHLDGDKLVQTSRTEVLVLTWPDLRLLRRLSHPLLHDVHDALPLADGSFLVTATGHDSVVHLDHDGALRAHHRLAPEAWALRYAQLGPDFRGVPFAATKPHAAHPNHLTLVGGKPWVTCLATASFQPLDPADGPPVSFAEGGPQDGKRDGALRWFTTVTGHVLALDAADHARQLTLDMHALDPSPGLPGWCRGVARVGSRLFVGMTALRDSAHREWLRQVLCGAQGVKRPTRVVEIDLDGPRLRAIHAVDRFGDGTLYAITPWNGP